MSRAPTRQRLTHYTAGCFDCTASVSSKNAQAWAHNHVAQHPGHVVELSLGYRVEADQ